jgi:threonine synthase
VLESNGFSLTVTDREILAAQQTLARKTGVFAEPAAAAAAAALKKIQVEKLIGPHKQIVLLITGHGLKDVDAAMTNLRMPAAIEPTLAGFEESNHR